MQNVSCYICEKKETRGDLTAMSFHHELSMYVCLKCSQISVRSYLSSYWKQEHWKMQNINGQFSNSFTCK